MNLNHNISKNVRICGSAQQDPLHLVVFLVGVLDKNSRPVAAAVDRAEVLHQRDPVLAAKVDKLDVLDPGLEVDPTAFWVDAML